MLCDAPGEHWRCTISKRHCFLLEQEGSKARAACDHTESFCVQVASCLTGIAAAGETCSMLRGAVEEAKGELLVLAQRRALLQVSS